MAKYRPPFEDITFVLNQLVDLEELSKRNGYQHADPETVLGVLVEAGRFFADVIAPTNRSGDIEGSTLVDGEVKTPTGFKEAYAKYIEAGWAGVHLPQEWGGGGFPYAVGIVLQEMFKSANLALSLCPLLTQAAIAAIYEHGSDEQRAVYLERLVTGSWTGTMCLTEPHAGSDLAVISTKAIPQPDGTYGIKGQKIFITWGDQDLTDNIVHLVLAKTPDAAPGTKGISLFVVPKFLIDDQGRPGEPNDITIVSIEHKLGIHGSPTCVMSFGDRTDGAVGYLVGETQQGMQYMFTMMNTARIGVGVEGVAIGERVYQQSLAYARERRQGRAVGTPPNQSSAIIEHPDIRRMLATMQAYTQAMRALIYTTAAAADRAKHADSPEEQAENDARVALLTPVVKAWCTDVGVELASLGIQLHGGMGFIEETGMAQYYRDVRIAPIYEGTNGIQAVDLVLRKLPLDDGTVVAQLLSEIETTVSHLTDTRLQAPLSEGLAALTRATDYLAERVRAGEYNDALAGATPYLRMFGLVMGGWLLARSATAAEALLEKGDDEFLQAKIATARFYCSQLLPITTGLLPAVVAGAESLGSVADTGI